MKEFDNIWEAAARAGKIISLRQKEKDVLEVIESFTAKRCGNCRLWMTKGCVPEQSGQFRSASSLICHLFDPKDFGFIVEEQERELESIREELQETIGGAS